MKNLTSTLILSAAMILQACDGDNNCNPATGEVMGEELLLDPFNQISLEIAATVYVSKGDERQVMVQAQRSIVDLLSQTFVTNDTWSIGFDECVNTSEEIIIFVTIPALAEVSVSGSGGVVVQDTFIQDDVSLMTSGSGSIQGQFETNSLGCVVSGSGGIIVSGTAQSADLSISGSGSVQAFDLLATACEVSVSGSGSASVNVSSRLDVRISGSGSVRYRGNPDITSNISGSGRLIDAN